MHKNSLCFTTTPFFHLVSSSPIFLDSQVDSLIPKIPTCLLTIPLHHHLLFLLLYHHSLFYLQPSTPMVLHSQVNCPNPKSPTYFSTTPFHCLILLLQPWLARNQVTKRLAKKKRFAGMKDNHISLPLKGCDCQTL